jgi:hypothetical protein
MLTLIASVSLASVIALPFPLSFAQATNSGGEESLGNKLLDDLPLTESSSAATAKPPEDSARSNAAEQASSESLPPVAPAMIPFVRVRQNMQNAQSVLAQPGSGNQSGTIKLASRVQHGVVSDLDQLIASLSKQCQCQGGQCDKPPQPNANSQPKPGSKPGAATAKSQAPARDSTDRLNSTAAQPVDKGNVDEAVKKLWGNLPERSREQMLQSFSDEFLPQYQFEIEQYYRRLSEEQGGQNGSPVSKPAP